MTKKLTFLISFVLTLMFIIQCSKDFHDQSFVTAAPEGKGRKPVAESVNNLSFPVIAVDNFQITPVEAPGWAVPYTGDYPGLTAEEISYLEDSGPWYPQKTDGNVWQAGYDVQSAADVTYIDWGDNIESVNPKVRTPFRLEVTLYKELESAMTAYTMEVLEYPSSSNELQGTNETTYENSYATVISAEPKLVIQYLGATYPESVGTWDGSQWGDFETIPVSFGPELNVGGKYIYGASSGGWKPDRVGYYRLTFYVPTETGIDLTLAQIGNFADLPVVESSLSESDEGAAADPKVDADHNLTYVDVEVLGKGGGGRTQ